MKQLVKRLPTNFEGRDIIIGDLHGCLDKFQGLMDKLQFDPRVDRVFSVGDLVDRGPNSPGCLNLLRMPWFHAVLGNHEDMMLNCLVGQGNEGSWAANGGLWFFKELEQQTADPDWQDMLANLPLAIVVGEGANRFNVLHSEAVHVSDTILDDNLLTPTQIDRMIWGRTITSSNSDLFDTRKGTLSNTFVGHTVFPDPFKQGDHIFLDTGAVFADTHPTLTSGLTATVVDRGVWTEEFVTFN